MDSLHLGQLWTSIESSAQMRKVPNLLSCFCFLLPSKLLVFFKMYIHCVISILKSFSVSQSLQNKIWAPSHSHCASNSLTLCLPVLFSKLNWCLYDILAFTSAGLSLPFQQLFYLFLIQWSFVFSDYTVSYLLSSSLFSLPFPFFSTYRQPDLLPGKWESK